MTHVAMTGRDGFLGRHAGCVAMATITGMVHPGQPADFRTGAARTRGSI